MNGTLISALGIMSVVLIMISIVTIPLLAGLLIYLFKTKENQQTKKKLKVILLILAGFYLITIIFSLLVNIFGLGSRDDRLEYAKKSELGQLFLEYYPEAETEFNAAGDMVTFRHVEGEASIYIQVPAIEYREGDGNTLYCYKNELTFEFSNLEEMREKLESQECFK